MNPYYHTQNYVVSYDLNGSVPTHAQVDKHIAKAAITYGRVLETVWFVQSTYTMKQLFEHVNSIMSDNDRVMVIEATDAYVRNLLVPIPDLQKAWKKAA